MYQISKKVSKYLGNCKNYSKSAKGPKLSEYNTKLQKSLESYKEIIENGFEIV